MVRLHALLWVLCASGCTARAVGGDDHDDDLFKEASDGSDDTSERTSQGQGHTSVAGPDDGSTGGAAATTGDSASDSVGDTTDDGSSTSLHGGGTTGASSTGGTSAGDTSYVSSSGGGSTSGDGSISGGSSSIGDGSISGGASSGGGSTSGGGSISGGSSSIGDGSSTGGDVPLPAREILFNAPSLQGDPDYTLEDELVTMIKSSVAGSSIRIAFYRMSRMTIAEALLAAKARGVDVRIVLDNGNGYPPGHALCPGTQMCPYQSTIFLRDNFAADELIECHDELYGVDPYAYGEPGCSGRVANYNKFALFSELSDGSRDVVVQSTNDFTYSAVCHYGSMTIIREDAALYATYATFWNDLAAEQLDPDYAWGAPGDLQETYVSFFPRAKVDRNDSEDTVLDILANVGCAEGASIRVAQTFWSLSRGPIASALANLQTAGCEVRVISTERADNVDPRDYGLTTARFPSVGPSCAGDRYLDQQHKVMLIDAPFGPPDARVWQKRVVVGSHSFSYNALRGNDEALLEVADDGLYDAYLAVWEQMWSDVLALGGG